MFKDAPAKILRKVKDFLFEAGPGPLKISLFAISYFKKIMITTGLGLGIFIFYWGEYEHKRIAYHHRS